MIGRDRFVLETKRKVRRGIRRVGINSLETVQLSIVIGQNTYIVYRRTHQNLVQRMFKTILEPHVQLAYLLNSSLIIRPDCDIPAQPSIYFILLIVGSGVSRHNDYLGK